MQPKDCYDNIAARARRLLVLHDGLVNRRRYRIRADWARAFLQLMHWPKDAAVERIDTTDAVIILRAGATLRPADFSADTLADLLRSSLTFGVSALDRYVHERVVKGIVKALHGSPLSRAQEELSMPAVVAIRIAEAVASARYEQRAVRPANEVRKAVQNLLHRRPFQNWRDIEYAFELLGVKGLTGILQKAYGLADISPVRSQLNKIAITRNLIVHEGHLVRHERGGLVRQHELGRTYVVESLDFLDGLVAKLEAVS